jgi:pimeloyl-ACP methyl ester carboxylesterase
LERAAVIKHVERGSIRLWSESFGDPGHSCALLISGAGAHTLFWPDEFCNLLAEQGLFLIRYDHRDIGYSTHVESDYDIFSLLGDSLAVLDVHGVRTAHFIGHSMGGYLVALAAVHQARRVLSATMISSGPTVTPAVATKLGLSSVPQDTWDALLENQPTGSYEVDLPGWMRSWRLLHGAFPLDETMAARYTRELYIRDPRDASVAKAHIAAMGTVPASLADDLTRVTTPSLVVHGTDDPLVPVDHGMALARFIPDCRLQLIPGAGHMFFHRDLWEQLGSHLLAHTRAV